MHEKYLRSIIINVNVSVSQRTRLFRSKLNCIRNFVEHTLKSSSILGVLFSLGYYMLNCSCKQITGLCHTRNNAPNHHQHNDSAHCTVRRCSAPTNSTLNEKLAFRISSISVFRMHLIENCTNCWIIHLDANPIAAAAAASYSMLHAYFNTTKFHFDRIEFNQFC